jgi:aminocarboxymuconate-semialdehyde decarboxylase
MARDYPDRFTGLYTLPIQNLQAAINELERSDIQLGLKGAMINDTVNGQTFDAPELLPFWQAAEQLGALIFVHQGLATVVSPRADRYHLPDTIGNLADRASPSPPWSSVG